MNLQKTRTSNPTPPRSKFDLGEPLKVIHGWDWASPHPVDHPWDERLHYHGKTTPDSISYSMVCWLCHGPIDRISRIRIGDHYRTLNLVRGGETYRDVISSEMGWNAYPLSMRIYWGTEHQAREPFLNGVARSNAPMASSSLYQPATIKACPNTHPPYKGIAYIVFYRFNFDFLQTSITGNRSIPDIQFEVYKQPSILVSGSDNTYYGVSWIGVLYDWLINQRYGLGISPAIIQQATWQALLDKWTADGFGGLTADQAALSPTLTASRKAALHIGDLLGYIDGFLTFDEEEVVPGWIPNQPTTLPELPTISAHDMAQPLEKEALTKDDLPTVVTVKFRNGDANLDNDLVKERSRSNRKAVADENPKELEVPAIIRPWPARAAGQRYLARNTPLNPPYILQVFRDRAVTLEGRPLRPGDECRLNYVETGLNVPVRVSERQERGANLVELTVETQANRIAEPYIPVADPRDVPEQPVLEPIVNWQPFRLPPAMVGTFWPPQVTIIAERPNGSIFGALCWISGNGTWSGEEQELDPIPRFFDHSVLASPLNAQADEAEVTITGAESLSLVTLDATEAEIADGNVILIINDEVMIYKRVDEVDGDYHLIEVDRGAFGTVKSSHQAGDSVWIIARATLTWHSHALLTRRPIVFDGQTATSYRLAPLNSLGEGTASAAQAVVIPDQWPRIEIETPTDSNEDDVFDETILAGSTLSVNGKATNILGAPYEIYSVASLFYTVQIVGISRQANIVLITTLTAHGFNVGELVTLAGTYLGIAFERAQIIATPLNNTLEVAAAGPDVSGGPVSGSIIGADRVIQEQPLISTGPQDNPLALTEKGFAGGFAPRQPGWAAIWGLVKNHAGRTDFLRWQEVVSPAIPNGLNATEVSYRVFRLTWNSSDPGVSGYWVCFWQTGAESDSSWFWVEAPSTQAKLTLTAGEWNFCVLAAVKSSLGYYQTDTSPAHTFEVAIPSISNLSAEWDGPGAGWFLDWTNPQGIEIDRYEVYTEDAYPSFDLWGEVPAPATGVQLFKQGEPVFSEGWVRIVLVSSLGDKSPPVDLFLSTY